MLKYYDDLFDKEYLDYLSSTLGKIPWNTENIANRYSYPSGQNGTHRLLGLPLYSSNRDYAENRDPREYEVADSLIGAFNFLSMHTLNRELKLLEISANLQFFGMDGTLHTDGPSSQFAFILLLSDSVVHPESGGGFYHDPSDTLVPYRYGRVVLLSASDLHRGEAFNVPSKARISIKFVGE